MEEEKSLTLYEQVWEYPFRKMKEACEKPLTQSAKAEPEMDNGTPLPKFEYHAVFSLRRRP